MHLWYTLLDDPAHLHAPQRYRAALVPEEAVRMARFRFDRDRWCFLVSRALLRWALSHYLDAPAHTWRFETGPHGRPRLLEPRGLGHNLSHTQGAVAIAVSGSDRLGIDVELTAVAPPVHLASRCFAEAEWRGLSSLAAGAAQRRFIELWTLKEAFVKATGFGLHLPLNGFSFDIREPAGLALHVPAGSPAQGEGLGFRLYEIGPSFLLALCAERPPQRDLRVRCWRTVPWDSSAEVALRLVRRD